MFEKVRIICDRYWYPHFFLTPSEQKVRAVWNSVKRKNKDFPIDCLMVKAKPYFPLGYNHKIWNGPNFFLRWSQTKIWASIPIRKNLNIRFPVLLERSGYSKRLQIQIRWSQGAKKSKNHWFCTTKKKHAYIPKSLRFHTQLIHSINSSSNINMKTVIWTSDSGGSWIFLCANFLRARVPPNWLDPLWKCKEIQRCFGLWDAASPSSGES